MGYKEHVENYRRLADRWEHGEQLLLNGDLRIQDTLREAAAAIESLLVERDAGTSRLEDKENQAYWAEYTGEDKGFHYCSNCKKQAFNFEDGSEVFEALTEFCPYCGKHMKNAEI